MLHYAPGQKYFAHYDFLTPPSAGQGEDAGQVSVYGQRAVKALVYLNDDFEGGETGFPHLKIEFQGKRGDALIFWNISKAGALERNSLHAGRPVVRGEKWLLSQWIRERPQALI